MKINELYILHRDVEQKYRRSVEELLRVELLKENFFAKFLEKQEEAEKFKL